jgi:hypothetical protein
MGTLGRALLLGTATLLMSCAPMTMTKQPIDGLQPRTFKFLKTKPDNSELSDHDVFQSIFTAIKEQTNFKQVERFQSRFTGITTVDLLGAEVNSTNGGITESYVNGTLEPATGKTYKTVVEAQYRVTIKTVDNFKIAEVTPPADLTTIPGRDALFLPIPTYYKPEHLSNDVKNIMAKMNPNIKVTWGKQGEINVKYSDEAVFANFTRLFGGHTSSKSSGEKQRIYTASDTSVEITVFPYRDGSKVVYKIIGSSMLDGNGGSTYNESAVKDLIAKVEKTAND